MPSVAAVVLGHQGGWDEMVLVVAPVALFAGLLYFANRRAATLEAAEGDAHADAPTPGGRVERPPEAGTARSRESGPRRRAAVATPPGRVMATIPCPHCKETVLLSSGIGVPGDKRFECSNGHKFGPGAPRPDSPPQDK